MFQVLVHLSRSNLHQYLSTRSTRIIDSVSDIEDIADEWRFIATQMSYSERFCLKRIPGVGQYTTRSDFLCSICFSFFGEERHYNQAGFIW